jgi:hypothetical protein
MISDRIKGSAIVALTLGVVMALATAAWGNGGILHRVSVGGPDVCEALGARPGCDANASLIAIQFYDGTIIGEAVDQWGHGDGGTHAVVDCLAVSDNMAWISGVFTNEGNQGADFAIQVVDNGTSANDPPHRISATFHGDFGGLTCEDFIVLFPDPDELTNAMPRGQVKVM